MSALSESENSTRNSSPVRVLRLPAVLAKVGISRSQLYRLINGGLFPRQFYLSARTAVWNEAQIDAWLADKQGGNHA